MTNQLPECLCPLIDTSTWGGKPSFLLGNPRGTGCPIHETQEMRDEVKRAEDLARYGIQLEFPGKISEQEAEEAKRRFLAAYSGDYPHIPMRPDPWLKPRPAPVDTSWITLETSKVPGWHVLAIVLAVAAAAALITYVAMTFGG
jgi:hypothetical protein